MWAAFRIGKMVALLWRNWDSYTPYPPELFVVTVTTPTIQFPSFSGFLLDIPARRDMIE